MYICIYAHTHMLVFMFVDELLRMYVAWCYLESFLTSLPPALQWSHPSAQEARCQRASGPQEVVFEDSGLGFRF